MNICTDNKNSSFIPGHIYMAGSGTLYIATINVDKNEKVSLKTGLIEMSSMSGGVFVDVTNQYCLQKVK